jgi:hypothetical protein
MTRGKYAAKAANRLAQLDNELLQEKIVEVADLKDQLAAARQQLVEEHTARDRLVLHRADELSQELLDRAHAEAKSAQDELEDVRHYVAEWVSNYVATLGRANPDMKLFEIDTTTGELGVNEFLHSLVGQNIGVYMKDMMGEHDVKFTTRRYRRATKNVFKKENSDRSPERSKTAIVGMMKTKLGGELTATEAYELEEGDTPASELVMWLTQDNARARAGSDGDEQETQ